jgi:hypothetical protein
MQKVILSLICLVAYCSLYAQETTVPTVPPSTTHKWEVGLDLLRFVDLNTVPENSIFFRRNYGTAKAIRFCIGGSMESYTNDRTFIGPYRRDTIKTFAPYISLGHEWQRKVGRFRYYTFTDATWSYAHFEKKQFLGAGPSGQAYNYDTLSNTIVTLGVGMGIQYRIFSTFSVSLESNLNAHYQDYYIKNYGKANTPGNIWAVGGEISKKGWIDLQPFASLRLIYFIPKKTHHVKT